MNLLYEFEYICICECVWLCEKAFALLWTRRCRFLSYLFTLLCITLSISFGVVDVSVFISLALKTQLSTAAVEQHIYYQLNGYYYSSFVRFSFSIFQQTNNFHFLLYFFNFFLIRGFFGSPSFHLCQKKNKKQIEKEER